MSCAYPGESLADVKEGWGGDRVSEVGGGEEQGRHLQIDQLQRQKQECTAEFVSSVTPSKDSTRLLAEKTQTCAERIEETCTK